MRICLKKNVPYKQVDLGQLMSFFVLIPLSCNKGSGKTALLPRFALAFLSMGVDVYSDQNLDLYSLLDMAAWVFIRGFCSYVRITNGI